MECGLRCAGDVGWKAPLDGRGNGCRDVQGMLPSRVLLPLADVAVVVSIKTTAACAGRCKTLGTSWRFQNEMFCHVRTHFVERLRVNRDIFSNPEERATTTELMSHPYLRLPPDWHFVNFTWTDDFCTSSFCMHLFILYTHIRSFSPLDNLFLSTHIPRVFIPFVEYSNNGDSSVAIFTIMSLISHWPVTTARFQIRHEMCLPSSSWRYLETATGSQTKQHVAQLGRPDFTACKIWIAQCLNSASHFAKL